VHRVREAESRWQVSEPRKLTSISDRRMARFVRDRQWRFMERCLEHDPLWFCVWNKAKKPELADEWRDGLITGLEINEWMAAHPDWFKIGSWYEKRYARPIRLTDVGRKALANREPYDMEPHNGGFVEPGYVVIPWPKKAGVR
jgi:hypothetical protein